MTEINTTPQKPSPMSWLLVAAFWLAIGLPAGWGVYRTAVNAKPLFHSTASATTAPAP